ncbi:MAG: hypothetical protein R3D32_15550 [Nitratireductor sp.]
MKKLAAILLMFGMVTQAKAWGPEGHVIVAMVAEARLSDGAKSAAREIRLVFRW